jgi:hypothetical protein
LTILSDMFVLSKCKRYREDSSSSDDDEDQDDNNDDDDNAHGHTELVYCSSMLVSTHIEEQTPVVESTNVGASGSIYKLTCVQPSSAVPFFQELTLLLLFQSEDLEVCAVLCLASLSRITAA